MINDIQLQYDGYLHTPLLWENTLNRLIQLTLQPLNNFSISKDVALPARLGKRVERFVNHELSQYGNIDIVAENIQIINNNNITLGELDFIIKQDNKPIHLEVIYKFYLYDINVGNLELDHWIGPNRNDSLVQKLTKLKEKQLPLLYKKETKIVLEKYKIDLDDVTQNVYFKAQLFIPYENKKVYFHNLNSNCVKGFFINYTKLNQFQNSKFYFPVKQNWLVEVHDSVEWIEYSTILEDLKVMIENKISPLCWIKSSNEDIVKMFIVWW